MLPPAITEQQAKLGVSVEESKAQRLKRQQARFRDRGGAFVPSDTNPLVEILLARTVSGESPSKKRRASSTRRAGAITAEDETQAVAGSSKSKLPASQKRKRKAVEPQAEKPASKRRGRPAKGKKKEPDADTGTEKPPPDTGTRSKSTSKGKGKQRNTSNAPSTSNGSPKLKPLVKTKSNPAKTVVEVLVSDDDRTLVEVPHKVKSNRNARHEDDEDTSGNTPIVRKRVLPSTDGSQTSNIKPAARVKAEKIVGQTSVNKCLVPRGGDDDDDMRVPVAKKGKAANSTSTKPRNTTMAESESAPRTTKTIKGGETSKATGHGRRKRRAKFDQDIVEPVEEDVSELPPESTSKPKKRKNEDNHDDRHRKVVKFSDTGPPHPSSQRLKENQSERIHKSDVAKSRAKDDPDALRPKLVTKSPSRPKRSKGPPREVLERIKASAARHLQCTDSEPDELDCLP